MDEYIENKIKFEEWMYKSLENGDNVTIGDVINKYEELKLNDCF